MLKISSNSKLLSLLKNNEQRGATMVEFALVIGLFLVLVLGFIDLSRYLFTQNLLTRAAEETVNIAKKDIRFGYDTRPFSVSR